MITARIQQFIRQEGLLEPHQPVLVAISGGADSVALIRILLDLNYPCEAAHCNFQLRGSESDADELFTRNLCTELGVKLHRVTFNTTEYAQAHKLSIEMAARELRYNWFDQIAQDRGIKAVAVAHHKDDSVETMLLNLIRGTGINGLLGIRPKHGLIVRPLLCCSRQEVVEYLSKKAQNYVTDRTNLEETYTRNKIRLSLLPIMESINPSVKDTILQTSHYLQNVAHVYKHAMAEERERVVTKEGIDIHALMQSAAPEALLFDVLHPLGFNPTQIKDIFHSLKGTAGKQFTSSNGYLAVKDRTFILLKRIDEIAFDTCPYELSYEEVSYTTDFVLRKEKHLAYFDADKLKGEFTVRKWQQGDWFIPFGMKGRKLISDFLTDNKFSFIQKARQWVLCCGDDIVWVIGERSDNRFRVDEKTHRIIKVSALKRKG